MTLTDLGLKKFCMKFKILPSIPASFMSNRMPCLNVESFALSMSKKMDTTCSLFAWSFLAVVVVCSFGFLSGQKIPTVLHLPFSTLLYIEHLLEQIDDSLTGL